jgi:hypothetical protein
LKSIIGLPPLLDRLKKLNNNNMMATNIDGTNVVIARINDKDVVFSKAYDGDWVCSVDPSYQIKGYGTERMELTWGSAAGDTLKSTISLRPLLMLDGLG